MIYGLVLSIRKNATKKGNRFVNLLLSAQGLLIVFAIVYSVVHILTWTLIRYRLPVDAVLIPFAGLALVKITQKFLPSSTNYSAE
jgi:hypothetical protein